MWFTKTTNSLTEGSWHYIMNEMRALSGAALGKSTRPSDSNSSPWRLLVQISDPFLPSPPAHGSWFLFSIAASGALTSPSSGCLAVRLLAPALRDEGAQAARATGQQPAALSPEPHHLLKPVRKWDNVLLHLRGTPFNLMTKYRNYYSQRAF